MDEQGKPTVRVHYLCDGNQEGCARRNCYKTSEDGKGCRYTKDVSHAINFHRVFRHENAAYWEGSQTQPRKEKITGILKGQGILAWLALAVAVLSLVNSIAF